MIESPKEPTPPMRVAGQTSASAPESQRRDVPSAAGQPDGRAIILAVEHDPHVRALEAYFLNEAGFAVEFAADGIRALEMTRAIMPRIIITELLVPGLDGLALCRAVRRDPALCSISVLVFSILAAETRAREAGADAFLLKPLGERRLIDTVRELLATRGWRQDHTSVASPPGGSRS